MRLPTFTALALLSPHVLILLSPTLPPGFQKALLRPLSSLIQAKPPRKVLQSLELVFFQVQNPLRIPYVVPAGKPCGIRLCFHYLPAPFARPFIGLELFADGAADDGESLSAEEARGLQDCRDARRNVFQYFDVVLAFDDLEIDALDAIEKMSVDFEAELWRESQEVRRGGVLRVAGWC